MALRLLFCVYLSNKVFILGTSNKTPSSPIASKKLSLAVLSSGFSLVSTPDIKNALSFGLAPVSCFALMFFSVSVDRMF